MLAREKLRDLRGLEDGLVAGDYHHLMQCHEVMDRLRWHGCINPCSTGNSQVK